MRSRTVTHEFDPDKLPTLTEQEKAEIGALKAMPDSEIDYGDIPELTEKFWKNAIQNPYFKPVKQQLTLRLDADLIAWFKHHAPGGRGYQTRINDALRQYVTQQEKGAE